MIVSETTALQSNLSEIRQKGSKAIAGGLAARLEARVAK